jgi:hypothetical protein
MRPIAFTSLQVGCIKFRSQKQKTDACHSPIQLLAFYFHNMARAYLTSFIITIIIWKEDGHGVFRGNDIGVRVG